MPPKKPNLMKEKWKGLSKTEKLLIISIIIVALGVLMNWKRVYEGSAKGFDNYKKETLTNDTLTNNR